MKPTFWECDGVTYRLYEMHERLAMKMDRPIGDARAVVRVFMARGRMPRYYKFR